MHRSRPDWSGSAEAAAQCGMAVAYHAAHAPQRSAVIAPPGDINFHELNRQANQLARLLRGHGLGVHSGVALICSNRAEFLVTHAACVRAGMRLTPVNWHLTGAEMAYIVADCEAEAIIAEGRFAAAATQAAGRTPQPKLRLAIGEDIAGFDAFTAAIENEDDRNLQDPTLGGAMLYTSGTTGHPKGVYRWPPRPTSIANVITQAMITLDPQRETALVTGPLYHAAPLNLNALPVLNEGAGIVLMDRWDAEQTLSLVQRHKVAYSHMVATMFHRLLRLDDEVRSRYDLSSLRALLHGAAPCPAHLKRAVIDWLGPIVYEYYAATEGGGTLVDSETWLARPGTVGRALPGAHVRVLDSDRRERGPGEIGTVHLKAPGEGRFVYFNAPEKTRTAYHDDYYTMGDQGYLDDEGYLFLTGRDAETIISAGVNIYPQEIDDVLLRSPKVHDVCTVGVPSEEWGEEVKAVVCLNPGIEPCAEVTAELLALCESYLARFKRPRSIDFDRDLPRLPSGKIQRNKVRARFWPGSI